MRGVLALLALLAQPWRWSTEAPQTRMLGPLSWVIEPCAGQLASGTRPTLSGFPHWRRKRTSTQLRCTAEVVKGFGCRPSQAQPDAPGPASESLQGTNPRDEVRRFWAYGDLTAPPGLLWPDKRVGRVGRKSSTGGQDAGGPCRVRGGR